MLRAGEIIILQKKHNWLSNTQKISPENIYMQVILYIVDKLS